MQSMFKEGGDLIALQDIQPFNERYIEAFNRPLVLPGALHGLDVPDYIWQWNWPSLQ